MPFYRRPTLLTVVALCVASVAWAGPVSVGPVTSVDPEKTRGRWDGWGVSLCWWASVFGDRDDLADLLFTTRTVVLDGQSLPGLGLTFVRYNAGACSPQEVGGQHMIASAKIPASRQIEGYWRDGRSADPRSESWDWSVDAKQRAMLQKARERGADRLELFSNSPMWWMCANRNPSGNANGGDNLAPENYGAFAAYLATVAQQAKDQWGISFTSVEPFNEPGSWWWKADGRQEGCHFSPEAQTAVIKQLRDALDQRGLRDMPVAVSDENTYDQGLATWESLDAGAKAAVGQVNVHGYQGSGGQRGPLLAAVAGKPLRNSEYGENDASGMTMARNLHLDFHFLHPCAWAYWQALDGGGWGLIRSNLDQKTIGVVNPKYYVLAQYSRHLRPGMTMLDTDDTGTIAAYDAGNHRLVIVVRHDAAAGTETVDLTKFARVEGPVTCWITEPKGTARYQVDAHVSLASKQLVVTFPADSIQTLEVKNVACGREDQEGEPR